MSCIGITDEEKSDGWLCESKDGKALFLFDENEVLKNYKTWKK
jgi:hypothetical protein